MKMRKYTLPKRLIAMLLSIVLVLSVLPSAGTIATASAAGASSGVMDVTADPNTMDSWRDAFLPDGVISTEHAGGIWTDKSVLIASDALAEGGALAGLGITAGENHFLAVLSAMGANSAIVGQGTTPTDTVFVLDISGSMSDASLRAMVAAANDAIHTLLGSNESNRVGVVVYATEAYDLLPLGRYTPVTDNGTIEYIDLAVSTWGNQSYCTDIRTARVETREWVENDNDDGPGGGYGPGGNGQWVTTVTDILKTEADQTEVNITVDLEGGTYIQGGLWKAWKQFEAATVTDNRTPVLVLMSDGAPTFVASDFNNVPDEYEDGDGNSSEDGEGFLSQLTAAYVKAKIDEKYSINGFDATPYIYTLGLGVETEGEWVRVNGEWVWVPADDVGVAQAVLDTSKTREGMVSFWNQYAALATADDKTMALEVNSDWHDGGDLTVTYDAVVNSTAQMTYVNKYFAAEDASDLSAAFQSIVNEISLNSGYYVTRLDGENAHLGGYITFVDEIGTGMEVKEIEGILIGDQFFTGEKLAKALEDGSFGTRDNPTTLGDNMVWALKERLGIADELDGEGNVILSATDIARDLLGTAYRAGQLSYDETTGEWSNYIAWFGDENGDFIGFWDATNPDAVIPENARYANTCYGMLGTTTDAQTTHASDMMYVAVQVSKPITNGEILTNSPQTVTFRVPASLLPTVTYQIKVDEETVEASDSAEITFVEADPIRLIYEVGVHSELNALNIQEFLRENYQAKNADGDYYLYTNAWYWEGSEDFDFEDWQDKNNHPQKGDEALRDTGKNHITYAYFEPGQQNEHYYYTQDTIVLQKTAGADTETTTDDKYEAVTGTLDTENVQYYYLHRTFVESGVDTAEGDAVTAEIRTHYEEIDAKVLDNGNKAQNDKGEWYVKAGTMRYNSIHDHDRDKAENKTGSFFARLHQLVDIAVNSDTSHHYEIAYLGNNGRVTYAPAQGIKLSKVMNDGSEPDATFEFEIALVGDTIADSYQTIHVAADGTETTGSAAVTGGKLTVSLKPGESIYILNIAAGTTYSITEAEQHDYKQSGAVNATGTIAENTVTESVFTNMVQYYGALTVTKTVTYLDGATKTDAAANKKFPVTVTLMDGENTFVGSVYVNEVSTPVTDGTVTFDIVDGQSVIISDIPVGVTYTVDEGTLPTGYTQTNAADPAGTIDVDGEAAVLTNQYDPEGVTIDDVDPTISVNVYKDLRNAAGEDIDWPESATFTFELLRYVPATATEEAKWDPTGKSVTLDYNDYADAKTNGVVEVLSAELSLEGISFDAVGDYLFRLSEKDEGLFGMTYDTTDHDFRVCVTDADLDGQLEISKVEVIDSATELETGGTSNWEIGATYINVYEVGTASLALETNKTLTGREMRDGEFSFTLTGLNGAPMPIDITGDSVTVLNGKLGHVAFPAIVYTADDIGTHTYRIEEVSNGLGGITYDKSVYEVTVVVSEDFENDAVTAEVSYKRIADADGNEVDQTVDAEDVVFANTYSAASTTVTLGGTKTLTGKDIADNMFRFVLEPVTTGAPMPVNATVPNTGASFTFGSIEFTAAGTYKYTITEENRGNTVDGMTYDDSVYNVTVVVTDNGVGRLVAVTTINGVEATSVGFTNTYDATDATVTLSGTKVVRNDTPKLVASNTVATISPSGYHFELKQGTTVIDTAVSGADGTFTFDALTFDAAGDYVYTISEVVGKVAGVDYVAASWTVEIKVRDNNGTLEASINGGAYSNTVSAGNTFTNTYTASEVPVELTAYKFLTGRDLVENEFTFRLTALNGAPMPAGAEDGTLEAKNAADGLVDFGTITYDTVGVYQYKIVETKDFAANDKGDYIKDGVHYSTMEYTVTVNVVDGGVGRLIAYVSSHDQAGNELPAQFFNRYSTTPVKAELAVDVDDQGIEEQKVWKELDDASSADDNKQTLANNTFKFKLAALNSAPMPDGAVNGEITVESDADGKIKFGSIEYTTTGVYEYLVTEVNEGAAAMSYDDTVYKFVVTVTDDVKDGVLEVKIDRFTLTVDDNDVEQTTQVENVEFSNTYKAKETTVTFTGLKTFTGGRDLKENEFSFTLAALNGAPMGVAADSETVRNAANGRFTFSAITFTEEGVYVYELTEVKGEDKQVTYDAAKYTLTVTVVDENGELKATTVVTKDNENVDEYGFTNIFAPASASVDIAVQKVLENKSGREMGLKGFKFQLAGVEKTGTVTAESDDKGEAKFTLTFTAEDIGKTFTYKLSEVDTEVADVTYDEKVYEIKVTVGQNKTTGELVLTVTSDGKVMEKAAEFVNTYAPESEKDPEKDPGNDPEKDPEKDPDESPKTMDEFRLGNWVLMMSVSAICLLAVIVLGKKRFQV